MIATAFDADMKSGGKSTHFCRRRPLPTYLYALNMKR